MEDFGLLELPRVHEVPEEAGQQLAHGAVDIYGGWERVMPEPRAFGYGFSEHNYSGTVRLNWTVRAELWAVGRDGIALQKADSEELFIGQLDAAHQPFIGVEPPKGRRGFYRFDMQIEAATGETVGSYSAYFKVVRPFWKVKLGVSKKVVRPGQRVYSRLENFGTETGSYGEAFSIERLEGEKWIAQPELTQDFWLLWGGILAPGRTGLCNSVQLPSDIGAGRYRFVKSVGRYSPGKRKGVSLTAPFTVATP